MENTHPTQGHMPEDLNESLSIPLRLPHLTFTFFQILHPTALYSAPHSKNI